MLTSSKSSVPDCRRPGNTHIRRFKVPSHTQVPNEIFDELMHDLSGAEFKVLCYIARRTYGFHIIEDSISLKQICDGILTRDGRRLDHGTGLARSTAVLAIRGLVSQGLVLAVRSRETSTRPGAGERFEVNRYRIVVEEGDRGREDSTEDGPKTGPRPVRKSDYASTAIKPGGGPEIEPVQKKVSTKESSESSSSSRAEDGGPPDRAEQGGTLEPPPLRGESAVVPAGVAEAFLGWANDRGVIRVRSDRKIGPPDAERISVWARSAKRVESLSPRTSMRYWTSPRRVPTGNRSPGKRGNTWICKSALRQNPTAPRLQFRFPVPRFVEHQISMRIPSGRR